MAAAAAAAKRTRKAQPSRRPAEYVRPYLSKIELALIIKALEPADGSPIDPSLASALSELHRWE